MKTNCSAKVMIGLLVLFAGMACVDGVELAGANAAEASGLRVISFLPESPVSRALRPTGLVAVIENASETPVAASVRLTLPKGIRKLSGYGETTVRLAGGERRELHWKIEASEALSYDLQLQLILKDSPVAAATLLMGFLPPLEIRKLPYIPEPLPVKTSILVGAHNCPLWEADHPEMWHNLIKHPERTPVLGFYAQENPAVADWETKWAAEHGVDFFIYCWYRASQGGAIKTHFGSAIHDALFKSKFVHQMKFTIMWENQSRGTAGVSDEKDLMTNLMPYWIENYFKHPGYLKVDNKPVLFIYRPEMLVQDLGGEENVTKAFAKMRQACREAGFDGLYLLGEYRGVNPDHLKLLKKLGLDYSFAYCWGIPNSPTPSQAVQTQMGYIKKTQELGILPQVVTVSQAWSGWQDEGSIWKIPPPEFEGLLRQAKEFAGTLPPDQLGAKMLLLDNWNEWGEGHYIAPYREFGFGYLDAVRHVFAPNAPEPHVDLIPEDIGHGPYDTAYKSWRQRDDELKSLLAKKVSKGSASEPGLVGWWAFDEEKESPVALDYSGNRRGGKVRDAERGIGIDGRALLCKGGAVVVDDQLALSPATAMTVECWVKAEGSTPAQGWFLNKVFGNGASGYRMGLMDGKVCFGIPQKPWSHHALGKHPVPVGRWVHLAGTYDGKLIRVYVDGEEDGSLERSGPINPNVFHLCLGNFELKHSAHFTGLLDEVKLYDRALTADELRSHYQQLAKRVGDSPAGRK